MRRVWTSEVKLGNVVNLPKQMSLQLFITARWFSHGYIKISQSLVELTKQEIFCSSFFQLYLSDAFEKDMHAVVAEQAIKMHFINEFFINKSVFNSEDEGIYGEQSIVLIETTIDWLACILQSMWREIKWLEAWYFNQKLKNLCWTNNQLITNTCKQYDKKHLNEEQIARNSLTFRAVAQSLFDLKMF